MAEEGCGRRRGGSALMGIRQKLGHKLLNFPRCFNMCLVELCKVKEEDAGTRKFSLKAYQTRETVAQGFIFLCGRTLSSSGKVSRQQ